MSIARLQPDTTQRQPQIKGVYIALLSQSGTNAPTAVVIKNTLPTDGNPEWEYVTTGVYRLKSTVINYFPVGLVTAFIQKNVYNGVEYITIHGGTEEVAVITVNGIGGLGANGNLAFTPITITLYDRLQD